MRVRVGNRHETISSAGSNEIEETGACGGVGSGCGRRRSRFSGFACPDCRGCLLQNWRLNVWGSSTLRCGRALGKDRCICVLTTRNLVGRGPPFSRQDANDGSSGELRSSFGVSDSRWQWTALSTTGNCKILFVFLRAFVIALALCGF